MEIAIVSTGARYASNTFMSLYVVTSTDDLSG